MYNQKHNAMAEYRVSLEIEIEADSPLEAAKKLQKWIRDPQTNWQYYVQDEHNKIHSVDLEEEDEDAVLPADDYSPIIKN